MTQMESPKRKLQKKNDYQRHKLFRKIKRRRKAQAEAEQQIAEKQLRKKLKLPKFDRGEDELSTFKKQVEMFNDANQDLLYKDRLSSVAPIGEFISDPPLRVRLVDRNRITVNPETGDVMEDGGFVYLDPVIVTGKMPDSLKQAINRKIESDRIQDLASKERLSPVDPIGEFIVESAAIGKLLELAGKAALYGIGRYGGKLGLNKLQGLARQKLLKKEFALSSADKQLVKDVAYSKPGYDHELIISPSKKQKRLQLSQPTYQVYTGNKHKISEVIDDSGNVNLANLFKIQNEALSNVPGGRLARHRLENPDWHKTDWNTFLHSRDAYQRALQAGYPNEVLFPTLMHDAGKLWAGDGHGPYGASIVKQIFPDATDEQIMAIYQHMDKVPESAMGKLVKGADIAEDNPFRVFKQDSNILKQNSNQNGLSNGKTLSDKIKQGYFNYTKGQEIPLNFDGNYFRVTKNIPQVMSEGDTGFKNFPVGEYYSENIDDYYKNVMQPLFDKYGIDPEMRLPRGVITVPEFDVTNGYGADYYNAYKDLLDKANRTNSYRDWQNVIDFENHIRNSLKYLPAVAPFAIGAKFNDYNSGKDIRIKPSKRGTFTKAAKQHGMSVQGFANRVLRNPSKYSAAMRKKANFAHNAASWKH